MTIAKHRALLQHLNFISHRVRHNDFVDMAHFEYDLAVMKMAESVGVLRYGAQNMRGKKPLLLGAEGRKKVMGGKATRAYYTWNSEQGCSHAPEECRFKHICSKCGTKGHKRAA